MVNDCFDALCKAETRDGVFGDFFDAWEYIDDAMHVYYRGIEHIDKNYQMLVMSHNYKVVLNSLNV